MSSSSSSSTDNNSSEGGPSGNAKHFRIWQRSKGKRRLEPRSDSGVNSIILSFVLFVHNYTYEASITYDIRIVGKRRLWNQGKCQTIHSFMLTKDKTATGGRRHPARRTACSNMVSKQQRPSGMNSAASRRSSGAQRKKPPRFLSHIFLL